MTKTSTTPARYSQGWIDQLDGRTSLGQQISDQWQQMTDDLGGADRLSLAQQMLIERALWLHHWLRQQELSLASGGEFDVGKHAAATNSLQGVLAKLGINRKPRDVGDLAEYLSGLNK